MSDAVQVQAQVTPTNTDAKVVDPGTQNSNPKAESFEAFVARMKAEESKGKEEPKQSKEDSILSNYKKELEAKEQNKDIQEESEEESEEEIEVEAEEQQEESNELPKTIKYKVDGEEIEVDLDEVPTLLSKAHGADKRFQEAAQIRKEAKEFVNFIKNDPIAALTRAGIDFEELAINHVHEMIQLQNMPEEQKEGYLAKKELEKIKQEQAKQEELSKKQREEQEAQELEKMTNDYKVQMENQIIEAMKANSHIPKTRLVADRFIHYMRLAIQQGIECTMHDLVPYVEKDFGDLIRQNKVNNFKQTQSNPKVSGKDKPKEKNNEPKKRVTSVYDLF